MVISIVGRYHRPRRSLNGRESKALHARPQPGGAAAERIPPPSKEMLVSKIGDKVIREPIPGEELSFDVKAWRAKLDALSARDFSPKACRKKFRPRRLPEA
jgi:hypothetical protein